MTFNSALLPEIFSKTKNVKDVQGCICDMQHRTVGAPFFKGSAQLLEVQKLLEDALTASGPQSSGASWNAVWVGGKRNPATHEMRWDGEEEDMTYTNWGTTHGKTEGHNRGEDWLCVSGQDDWKWHDCHGRNEKLDFVCESRTPAAQLDLDAAVATSGSAVGFDKTSEATDGKVAYAADGDVASWQQAIKTEQENADRELTACKTRANQAFTAAEGQASDANAEAKQRARAKQQQEDDAMAKQTELATQALDDAATHAETAVTQESDTYNADNGPLATYEAKLGSYNLIKDEKVAGQPVEAYWAQQKQAARNQAQTEYDDDVTAYQGRVKATRDDAINELSEQDRTEKAACVAVKGDLSMELTKVGEILGKITTLTGVDAHSRRQGRKLRKGQDSITAANVVESTGAHSTFFRHMQSVQQRIIVSLASSSLRVNIAASPCA